MLIKDGVYPGIKLSSNGALTIPTITENGLGMYDLTFVKRKTLVIHYNCCWTSNLDTYEKRVVIQRHFYDRFFFYLSLQLSLIFCLSDFKIVYDRSIFLHIVKYPYANFENSICHRFIQQLMKRTCVFWRLFYTIFLCKVSLLREV